MSSGRAWLWALLVGTALTVLGGATPAHFLLYPGLVLVWPIWPEGVHTGGPVPSALWPHGFYFASALFWVALIRAVLALLDRARRRPAAQRG